MLSLHISCNISHSPNSYVVLLNNDTLRTESLKNLHDRGTIFYKPYEGFLLFTDDSIFHDPFIILENSTEKIDADVLSTDEVDNLIDNKIVKILYTIDTDSKSSETLFFSVKEQLKEKYKFCKIVDIDKYSCNFLYEEKVLCKFFLQEDEQKVIIELYPRT